MTAAAEAVMPVPAVDVAAARADAERLRRVARLSAMAAVRVADTAPSQWYGGASTAYDVARAELARCVDDLQRLSRTAAEAVAAYADTVAPVPGRMRSAAGDLDAALWLQASDYGSPRARALVEQAWREYDAAARTYRGAVESAVDVLRPLPSQTSPAAQGPGRHLEAGVRRFWNDAVAEPLALAWDLTAGAVQDPEAWWALVSSLPGAVADMVRHPLRTLDEAVAGPQWRAGEWGVAAGATLSMASPVKLASLRKLGRHRHNMADVDAPRPRLQTVDELFVRVDLQAHEHYTLGHTIRRHVDVTDEYLEDRLRDGTLYDEGVLGPPPKSGRASAWTDLETAEEWITDTLRVHEKLVREWAVNPTTAPLALEMPADPSVGRVMTLVDDAPRLSAPTTVKVVLMKDSGSVFIRTAHPDGPRARPDITRDRPDSTRDRPDTTRDERAGVP
jgi:hypothetical protein